MDATPVAAAAAAARVLWLPLDALAAPLRSARRGAGRASGDDDDDDDDDDDEGMVDELGIRRGKMDGCERMEMLRGIYGCEMDETRDDAAKEREGEKGGGET